MNRLLPAFASALFVLVATLAAPAWADDADTCKKVAGDDSLAACTRLISSQALRGGDLAQAYASRGVIYIRFKGDWDRAIADYGEALRLDPKNAGAHAGRAAAYLRKGDVDRALPDLNEGLRLDPKNSGVHNVFGYYYSKKGDYERALTEVNEALRLYPQYLYAFDNRGEIYENKGELNRALADFRAALGFDPDKKQRGGQEAAEGIARVEQKLAAISGGDWAACSRAPDREDGISACTRLITAKKLGGADLGQAYIWRGIGYWHFKGDYDLAITDTSEGIRFDPTIVAAYSNRGASYLRKGNLDLALKDLNEGLRLNPNNGVVHNGLGLYHIAKGEYDSALVEFNTAIRLFPQYLYAYRSRAQAYENKGELDKALADFRAALGLDPDKKQIGGREAAEGIARVEQKLAAIGGGDRAACARAPDREDGISACTRLVLAKKLGGTDIAQAYISRGTGYLRFRGDYDLGLADFSEAIRLDPKIVAAYAGRAASYVRKGNLDLALEDLNEGLRLNPNNAAVHNGLGLYHMAKGEYDSALVDFNTAIRLVPQYLYAYSHRAEAYESKGDLAAALADFRVALGLDPDRRQVGGREAAEGIARVEQKLAAKAGSTKVSVANTRISPPAVAPVVAPIGRRVALVIGNSKYRYAPQLRNPSNDASDIAQALRKLGFDVVEGRDLDKHGMEDRTREFGRKLEGADLALFFYAGHGLQVAGKNYLVPIDAKIERAGDLSLDTIEVGQILAPMEAEKRVNLVFLDACRDNPLARSLARTLGTRSTSVGSGLAAIQSAVGTMIAYATQPDNVALDGDGRNSPFTAALLKHIATPNVEIGTIMRRVRADVVAATLERQVPWDSSSLIGEVILAR